MNPPPMIKLITANGRASEAPSTPRLITIIIPPVITVNPAMRPISVATDCPTPVSHQKIADQLVGGPQKPGESNAAAFNSIKTADTIASVKPHTARLPMNRDLTTGADTMPGIATPPVTNALRLCRQYGQ